MENSKWRKLNCWLKKLPTIVKILILTVVIVSIIIGIYSYINGNFDFVSIQDDESKNTKRLNSIQIIESLKLVLLITTPILTMILFLNTINVQSLNSKNLGKDSMSKDFYNLLGLFKQEQEKSKDSLDQLARKVKSYLTTIEWKTHQIEMNKVYPDQVILDRAYFSKQCPNYLDYIYITEKNNCRNNIITLHESIRSNFKDVKNNYEIHYPITGTYFRILHRLVKVINDRYENGIISEDERMMYIGILRAQLSIDELLVLLVNSLETSKGIGLGVELMGCSFFGDEIDIDNNQHFDCSSVYRDNLKKYFVHSINSEKERKYFRKCYLEFRGDKDITNFQSLIDKIG